MMDQCCKVNIATFFIALAKNLGGEAGVKLSLSGQDWVSLVSEIGKVRTKLKQSVIVSERAMLTAPSVAGSLWSAKWEQQAG